MMTDLSASTPTTVSDSETVKLDDDTSTKLSEGGLTQKVEEPLREVAWDGEDDPQNPQNWPLWKKWWNSSFSTY